MGIKSLALQLLQAKHGAKPQLKKLEKSPKLLPTKSLAKFSPVKAVPYLDEQGRFCVKGGLLDMPILDALLQVGASDHEIEKHIHPLGTHYQWARWMEIKNKRKK